MFGNRNNSPQEQLIHNGLIQLGITDQRVIDAIRKVPRERFVPEKMRQRAYDNRALPIGCGQTISQPYVVAVMAQALCLEPSKQLLEIGTGSGYSAAIYAELTDHVCTMERHPELAASAREQLLQCGYDHVQVHCGDGTQGWPGDETFDAISVAAATPDVPEALFEQLRCGGRMVVPVGEIDGDQELILFTKTDSGIQQHSLGGVRFVPLISESTTS